MSGSTPAPDNHKHSDNMPKSHFNKTVCLSDWWLVKLRDSFQGRRLAVAGYPYRGKSGSHAMRVFTSGPILKRHHVFSIETTDGISVFFEGFINKARTEENGFTSDVYSHFVFGFPPYWREYAEILMDEGSSSVGTSGITHLKSPSPQTTEFESGQPHVDNCAEDFQSQQKSKKTESPYVSSPRKTDSVTSDPENNIIISDIAPEGLEIESYSRGPTVEEDHNILAVMDEVEDDTQVDTNRGVLLACELHSKSTDDLSNVGLEKINSSLEILNRTEGRARTRSMNNSEMKQKNAKKSARISEGEKIRSNFALSMGPKKLDSVIRDPENNLITSCIAPEGLENESYSRGPTVEDHNFSAVMEEVVGDTQVDTSRGVLLACELHSKSTDDPSKVGLDKINSSLEILSHTKGRGRKRSMNDSEVKQKNNKRSARISVGEKMRSKFVPSMGSETVENVAPVGCEPDQGRNNWNFEAFEFHSCTDKTKLGEFGTPKVKNKGNIKKATRSMGMAAVADNQEDNVTPAMNNVPDKAKSSGMKTRRKLEYQTPDREKDEVASPQCMSFKRSRSGRLLMPTLEFWRNQRAVYGSDRTITGIEEGRLNPDPQGNGRPSTTPRRKRR